MAKDFFEYRKEIEEGMITDKVMQLVKVLKSKLSAVMKKMQGLFSKENSLEKKFAEIDYDNLSPEEAEKKEADIETQIMKVQKEQDKLEDLQFRLEDKIDQKEGEAEDAMLEVET